MTGHEAIRAYWQDQVVDRQDDISFGSDGLHVDGDRALVHWWSSYVRKRDGQRFSLDGAFVFEFDGATGLCRSLREWWHADPSFLTFARLGSDISQTPIDEHTLLSRFDAGPARRTRVGEVTMSAEPCALPCCQSLDKGLGVCNQR